MFVSNNKNLEISLPKMQKSIGIILLFKTKLYNMEEKSKKSKSIFKKWWFWVIVIVIGLALIGSSGGSKTQQAKTVDKATSSSQAESKESKPALSAGRINALAKAKLYTSTMSFSRDGLIKQLVFEKFDEADASYAVDNIGADWKEQAGKKAKTYNDTIPMSRDGLIKQLVFDKFTQEQAEFGATSVGL